MLSQYVRLSHVPSKLQAVSPRSVRQGLRLGTTESKLQGT